MLGYEGAAQVPPSLEADLLMAELDHGERRRHHRRLEQLQTDFDSLLGNTHRR